MILWKCSFCESSSKSDKQRKRHEITCFKNPQNKNMTSAQFKNIMEMKKKRGSKI